VVACFGGWVGKGERGEVRLLVVWVVGLEKEGNMNVG
jgi:hypothetical protein